MCQKNSKTKRSKLISVNGTDTSAIRRSNMLMILRAAQYSSAVTLTELVRKTGISRPTTQSAVDDLMESGWLEEINVEESVGRSNGRPARHYRFRAEAGYVIGVDVGEFKVMAQLADCQGRVLTKHRIQVRPEDSPEKRIEATHSAIEECLKNKDIESSALWGITIGSPGVIDERGYVLNSPILGWNSRNLAEEFGRKYECQISIENDCNLAVLAENWVGAVQEFDDVVYVLSGMRTGAGLLLGGNLHRGHSGAAGETGALRQLGWAKTQDHFLRFSSVSEDLPIEQRAEYIFSAAQSGDAESLAVVDAYTKDLSTGMAALILTLDPQVIVLGGGISKSGNTLLDYVKRHLTPLCITSPNIVLSTLGDESVSLGAIRLALDKLEERIYASNLPLPLTLRKADKSKV